MTEPVSAGSMVVTAGGITLLGVATGLHPALMLAGAAGGWWAMSYQSQHSAWSRINRIVVSALVSAWGAPVLASLDVMPAAVPRAALQLALALTIGLVTIDVLGRGLLGLIRNRLGQHASQESEK